MIYSLELNDDDLEALDKELRKLNIASFSLDPLDIKMIKIRDPLVRDNVLMFSRDWANNTTYTLTPTGYKVIKQYVETVQ